MFLKNQMKNQNKLPKYLYLGVQYLNFAQFWKIIFRLQMFWKK